MPVGQLVVRVELDNPRETHYGPSSIVSGNIVLYFMPDTPSTTELFGPLQVSVIFHGRAKSKIWERRGQHTSVFRGRAPLFSTRSLLHDGPLKIPARSNHKIPFALQFPDAALPCVAPTSWSNSPRYHGTHGGQLPPTMRMNYNGFAHHFLCFTEYRVGASVSMPQIDVRIQRVEEDAEPAVLYEQPATTMSYLNKFGKQTISEMARIQNEYLLPEEQRPSGFKQKTKAFFKSDAYPVFLFDIMLSVPSAVCVGGRLSLEVNVRLKDSSDVPVVPDLRLAEFLASLEAYTEVRSEPGILHGERESHGRDTVATFTGGVRGDQSFSKANDWTQVVQTSRVCEMPSTFCTYNIRRIYTLVIRFTILAANKKTKVERQFPITVLPPADSPPAMNGQSSSAVVAGPSTQTDAELPAYDRPPEYEFKDGDGKGAHLGNV